MSSPLGHNHLLRLSLRWSPLRTMQLLDTCVVKTSPSIPSPATRRTKIWGSKGEKKIKKLGFVLVFASQLAQPLNNKAPLLQILTKRNLGSSELFPRQSRCSQHAVSTARSQELHYQLHYFIYCKALPIVAFKYLRRKAKFHNNAGPF